MNRKERRWRAKLDHETRKSEATETKTGHLCHTGTIVPNEPDTAVASVAAAGLAGRAPLASMTTPGGRAGTGGKPLKRRERRSSVPETGAPVLGRGDTFGTAHNVYYVKSIKYPERPTKQASHSPQLPLPHSMVGQQSVHNQEPWSSKRGSAVRFSLNDPVVVSMSDDIAGCESQVAPSTRLPRRKGRRRVIAYAGHRYRRLNEGHMQRLFIPILLLVLAGCGAEVAGTAAVVGAAKVKEAQEAQKQKEQIQQRLDAAAELERQRLKAAEGQ